MLLSENISFERILVTSDIFKVDDRVQDKHTNPQRINADWLKVLVSGLISENTNTTKVDTVHGDEGGYESYRWRLYSECGLPLDSQSWASIYEGVEHYPAVEKIVDEAFHNSLVISFEASPCMIKAMTKKNIPYIDFAIHPVRYLPDYMFGIRTNVSEWQKRIERASVPEAIFEEFARVSKARTTRIMRKNLPADGSALFLGQIEIDSSLIAKGVLADQEDIENSLIELSSLYPKVYYKRHPHTKIEPELRKMVSKIRNCEWIDVNIYDGLGCGRFDMVATMSSGSATEARHFGLKSRWMLERTDYFDTRLENKSEVYSPIYEDALKSEFWNHVINKGTFVQTQLNPFQGIMKFSLNMKWGR